VILVPCRRIPAVDPVGGHDQVGRREAPLVVDVGLELDLDAERLGPTGQDIQQDWRAMPQNRARRSE